MLIGIDKVRKTVITVLKERINNSEKETKKEIKTLKTVKTVIKKEIKQVTEKAVESDTSKAVESEQVKVVENKAVKDKVIKDANLYNKAATKVNEKVIEIKKLEEIKQHEQPENATTKQAATFGGLLFLINTLG